MKIRNGFVTNSSSSSFILSKELNLTVEEVYQFIRDIYKRQLEKYKHTYKEPPYWYKYKTYKEMVKKCKERTGEPPFYIIDIKKDKSSIIEEKYRFKEVIYWYEEEDEEYSKKLAELRENKATVREMLIPLGKIFILSDCGNLSDEVVEQLYDISDYACNHMG